MEKLLIVDGNSILNRAYYGIRPLTAPDGTPTNAVYGFLNILLKYLEEEQPTHLLVAFDVKEKTFRHKMYDLYKAQRKPAPEDFLVQLPLIKEVLSAMHIATVEKPGYEADDIIGTVARLCDEKKVACRILTGDKDDLQLASENTVIKLVITRMGKTETTDYNHEAVLEKYGVTPEEFIDVKGLMGDTSDNIPGVKGIGEKTAFALIEKYHSIENIYAELDTLEATPSVKKKLMEGKEDAAMSKTLATIDCHVPMELDFDAVRMGSFSNPEVGKLFMRLNFHSFLQKLNIPVVDEEEAEPICAKYQAASWQEIISKIQEKKSVDYLLSKEDTPRLYVTLDGETVYGVDTDETILKDFFEDSTIQKCGYGTKEDMLYLLKKGIGFQNLGFDVALAAYLAEPVRNQYDLETLCPIYLRQELSKVAETTQQDGQMMMDFGASEEKEQQAMADQAAAIFALRKIFEKKLKEDGQENLYFRVELPLASVLAGMEHIGVYVDKEALSDFGNMLQEEIAILETEIHDLAGEDFNINSPKQLGEILFGKLQLPGGKKNKNGYSTNVDVLEKLKDKHPIAQKVLRYRQLTKLKSTYVEGLLPLIDRKTGRIHSKFHQTVTATGRISSSEPNLQNIPVRTQLGRELRKMFVAGEDCVLVDADYSQIELRVLAHISGDETMQNAFLSGDDIHTRTAAQVFGVPMEEVTFAMRSGAKAVNFGIVYGIGAFSLSQDLGISVKEADAYIKGYLENYPRVDAYMKKTVADATEKGYVETLLGRRRNMPELKASNYNTRAFGERVCMNAPIQGTAADIIKIAMVRVDQRLKEEGLKSRLILQVHDELIIEARIDEVEKVKTLLKEEMEKAYSLSVPLVVDMNVGKSWYDTK